MEVNFSKQGTGACPLCKHFLYGRCHILSGLSRAANEQVQRKYDYVMEIVIYRCPEFEEKQR